MILDEHCSDEGKQFPMDRFRLGNAVVPHRSAHFDKKLWQQVDQCPHSAHCAKSKRMAAEIVIARKKSDPPRKVIDLFGNAAEIAVTVLHRDYTGQSGEVIQHRCVQVHSRAARIVIQDDGRFGCTGDPTEVIFDSGSGRSDIVRRQHHDCIRTDGSHAERQPRHLRSARRQKTNDDWHSTVRLCHCRFGGSDALLVIKGKKFPAAAGNHDCVDSGRNLETDVTAQVHLIKAAVALEGGYEGADNTPDFSRLDGSAPRSGRRWNGGRGRHGLRRGPPGGC